MTQERATSSGETSKTLYQKVLSESYYGLLGLHPSASVREIRQAYREMSKLYHPDTTLLPTPIATNKFQQLNEAYATLSSPERRTLYDRKIGYSSVAVVQPLPTLNRPSPRTPSYSSSAYLDATDRPLSPGEIFALFILGVTFVGCLILAIAIGLTRGETVLQTIGTQSTAPTQTIIGQPQPLRSTPEDAFELDKAVKPNPAETKASIPSNASSPVSVSESSSL